MMGEGGGRPRGTPLRGKRLGGMMGEGDGSPHPRGQRRGTPLRGMGLGGMMGEGGGRPRGTPLRGKGLGGMMGGRAVREQPLRGMGSVEEGAGGKGSRFVVIGGPRWYSAFLKWEEYVRLSYTHFPQRRRFISD